MSSRESGRRFNLAKEGAAHGYESHRRFRGMAGFQACIIRRLPVALKKTTIICWRDGFLRPVIFKKRGDECRHEGGLQQYRNPRGSL